MFNVEYNKDSQIINLSGNLDSAKAEEVKSLLGKINNSITVDMSGLDFISSAGIGVMLLTYQRLKGIGENIYLVNLNENIKKVFRVSLLDKVFNIK
jgi:anti-anti-sigma factor